MAKVLVIEPFYGGSHKAFLDGLVARSGHDYHLLTQPPYFWKWRMRGAAMDLSEQATKLKFKPDLVLASDMLSLSDFMALYPRQLPALLYMHENQLSYPQPTEDHRDLHYGFTNLTSCLAANRVIWNSSYHMECFLSAIPDFIKLMPDHRPQRLDIKIREKSLVIAPGVDLCAIDEMPLERDQGSPIIAWNHRWEYDKRPEIFFDALDVLANKGLDFRVCVLGENFQVKPVVFIEAKERLGDRALHFGYAEDRADYVRWLRKSSISVSTASQENFGIAAVEAAYAGARPLWPDKLSYPELIDIDKKSDHLYSDQDELLLKLEAAIIADSYDPDVHARHADSLRRFDWSNLIGRYDDIIEKTANG